MAVLDQKEEILIELLNNQKKANSLRWNFLRGIIYGFGFFIGSAILVTLLIYFLSYFDTAPLIGSYVTRVLEFINK